MAKRIIWSPNAFDDRLNILEYWAHRLGSKHYSQKINKDFIALSKYLVEFRLMGKKFRYENERCFIKGDYRIVYQITEGGI